MLAFLPLMTRYQWKSVSRVMQQLTFIPTALYAEKQEGNKDVNRSGNVGTSSPFFLHQQALVRPQNAAEFWIYLGACLPRELSGSCATSSSGTARPKEIRKNQDSSLRSGEHTLNLAGREAGIQSCFLIIVSIQH